MFLFVVVVAAAVAAAAAAAATLIHPRVTVFVCSILFGRHPSRHRLKIGQPTDRPSSPTSCRQNGFDGGGGVGARKFDIAPPLMKLGQGAHLVPLIIFSALFSVSGGGSFIWFCLFEIVVSFGSKWNYIK